MSISVVVAEDDYLLREGIRRVLEAAPDIAVVAECADGDELLAAVDASAPDVVVTDIRMPPSDVDEGIRHRQPPAPHAPGGRRGGPQPVRRARVRARAARGGVRPPRLPAQGARPRPRSRSSARSARSPLAGPRSTRRSSRVWSPAQRWADVAAGRAHRRASSRCSARSRRARATPPSPSRWC